LAAFSFFSLDYWTFHLSLKNVKTRTITKIEESNSRVASLARNVDWQLPQIN